MTAFPAVVEPTGSRDPGEWGARHGGLLREMLDEHGAVLLRGFDVIEPQAFSRFMSAATAGALPYVERSSPRRTVLAEDNVYTSTQYPAEREIFLHNEQSYNLTFPLLIAFCCLRPAAEGGETPIADTRKIYGRLSPATREDLPRRKYAYLRNYDGRFGLPWNTVFQTNDRREVESYCRANEIELEWSEPGAVLRTRQIRDVVARHPRTGECCWFNHATFFHSRSQDADVIEMLLELYEVERKLPHAICYGDGDDIPVHVIDELRAAYIAERVVFPWQKGDILVLDNMLASHGRTSFCGEREVIAAMAEPVTWESVRVAELEQGAR